MASAKSARDGVSGSNRPIGSVLVTEFMAEGGLDLLRGAGLEVSFKPDLWGRPDSLLEEVREFDALIVRNQTQVTAALLKGAPRLRVLGRLGVGVDNIDTEAAGKLGVPIALPQGANATAVAEYVLAALFHFSRSLCAASDHVAGGGWERAAFGGFELKGKTLGIVGLGDIGARLARRARALGMGIVATDPMRSPSESVVKELEIGLVSLDELLARSEFVSLHVPLTEETLKMVDAGALARMQRGSYLVNSARGELVDAHALRDALVSGHLAGAVLDSVEPEPLPAEHVLRNVPNLAITPHLGGLTREAQDRISVRVAEQVVTTLEAGLG